MTKNTRFSPEVRQRAVRMVLESQGEYDSQWAAICSIAQRLAVRRRLCVCGFVSMSGIPGVVMVDSPPLNVSV
ncbi:Transposase [Escherichia coli]|nr:Transposase [Escherichia coli]